MKNNCFTTSCWFLLHQNITDNLEYKNTRFYLKATNTPETKLKGREVFSHLFDGRLKSKLRSFSCFEDEDAKQYIDNTLGRFNHYLHFLEGILKFIDESDLLEDKERQLYVVILRNTFSDSERCIIVYYFAVQGYLTLAHLEKRRNRAFLPLDS